MSVQKFALSILLFCGCHLQAAAEWRGFIPYPIEYSIPEAKVVQRIPVKDLDFAAAVPGEPYLYAEESAYYRGYQRAFYAVTTKKAGWDCLRHYEILANGCIPYFLDLDQCSKETMYFLPRELIQEAMHLDGVSYLHIDHSKFNKKRYYEILDELLQYTRDHLTTRQMAAYLLKTLDYSGQGKILVLSQDTRTEYMRDLILIGLKELLHHRVIDFPKIPHIYQSYSQSPGS